MKALYAVKVLQIYKDYYPPVVGGIERHINLLSLGLFKRGVDVTVLVSNTGLFCESGLVEGIKVVKVPEFGRCASAPVNPTLFAWLKRLGGKADLLHFHLPNPTAVLSYLISGLHQRVVVTYHSDIVRQARLKIIFTPFLNVFLRRADLILATSPNYIESSPVLRRFRQKCLVVPLGVDLDQFNPPGITGGGSLSKSENAKPILLFVGRFRHYKGLNVLLESMKKIDAQLWLVGSGPLEKSVRAMVAQNGLTEKVRFFGQLSDMDLVGCLKACDMLVLPSNFRSEAFGIVQLEAMACGKPVICTELKTGTSFVNQHNATGLVVAPNSPDAIARAANYLISNPDVRRRFGRNGAACVDSNFSSKIMTEKILRVYRSVCAWQ